MLTDVIDSKGVNVNVKIDANSLLWLIGGVFIAVLIGGVLVKVFTKNL